MIMGRKFDRQIDIINSLVPGNRIQCKSLAVDFGVSEKTIKQDILELSLYYPVDTYRGKGGGIEMRRGYVINGYIMKKRYLDLIAAALVLYSKTSSDPDIEYLIGLVSRK